MGRRRRQRFKSRKKCSSSSESGSESKSHDNATNSKSCKVISKLLLPEDMMLGILSWVPLTWLLNSARYVCKPWATIIRSSHFAETHLNHARAKPGIYVQSRQSGSSSYFLDIKDDDVINGQFERTDLGTPPRMGHVMSTCDGILLLFDQRRGPFVVNPILKCWLRIPPLLISQAYHSGICHFTIARVPRTAKFKLFFVDALKVSSANWYVLYVLRIGIDNSWKEIARKEAPLNWCLGWAPVYRGGNDIYWITTEGVIVMDVDTEITVGEYPPPPPTMAPGYSYGWEIAFLTSCIKMLIQNVKMSIQYIKSTFWILIQKNGLFIMRWDLLIMWRPAAMRLVLSMCYFVSGSTTKLSSEHLPIKQECFQKSSQIYILVTMSRPDN